MKSKKLVNPSQGKLYTELYRKCFNCERTEFEIFIHINGLCVPCQLLKDKRLIKSKSGT